MAATTTTTYTLSFSLNLVRGGETAKRTLTFDYVGELTESAINTVAQQWLTNYNKLVQPSNWRDSDATEEEWATIGITPATKTTTTTTYDGASEQDGGDEPEP